MWAELGNILEEKPVEIADRLDKGVWIKEKNQRWVLAFDLTNWVNVIYCSVDDELDSERRGHHISVWDIRTSKGSCWETE